MRNVRFPPIAVISNVGQAALMGRTILTAATMALGPPTLLFALAHLGAFASHSALIGYAALLGAWAMGMTALAMSGWPRKVSVWVGVAYTIAAVPILPFVGLLAVCSTGDCI